MKNNDMFGIWLLISLPTSISRHTTQIFFNPISGEKRYGTMQTKAKCGRMQQNLRLLLFEHGTNLPQLSRSEGPNFHGPMRADQVSNE
jgi:hypothetical protein